MTNSIQGNSSTILCKIDGAVSEIRRVSQENERLFLGLCDSLDDLSEQLIKLDLQIKKKLIKDDPE